MTKNSETGKGAGVQVGRRRKRGGVSMPRVKGGGRHARSKSRSSEAENGAIRYASASGNDPAMAAGAGPRAG